MSDDKKIKRYDFMLPVHKQGDDMAFYLKKNPGNLAQALTDAAECYERSGALV